MKSTNIRLKTSRLIIFIYPRLLVYMIERPSSPVSLCCSLIAHRKISVKTIRWKLAFLWQQCVSPPDNLVYIYLICFGKQYVSAHFMLSVAF
jgi:hypothetical protein